LKAGLGFGSVTSVKGSPPEAEKTGWAKLSALLPPLRPGGFCSVATSEDEALEHSELDRGWIVAKAGAAIIIIAAIIAATVPNKSTRFISATSFPRNPH